MLGFDVTRDWSWWLAQKGGRVGLFLASTSMVVLMPLIFEINREVMVSGTGYARKVPLAVGGIFCFCFLVFVLARVSQSLSELIEAVYISFITLNSFLYTTYRWLRRKGSKLPNCEIKVTVIGSYRKWVSWKFHSTVQPSHR